MMTKPIKKSRKIQKAFQIGHFLYLKNDIKIIKYYI